MGRACYDVAIIGGGMGGSALGGALAREGLRVVILERERQFRDRVRGEGMHAWGVPEARALGIYEQLRAASGIEVPYWDIYIGERLLARRDFTTTTPHGSPLFSVHHPRMQEMLLDAAGASGAEVRRGTAVRGLRGGIRPIVTVEQGSWTSEIEARLVVAADGRNSAARKWGGFEVCRDPDERLFTGVLLEDVDMDEDAWLGVMNPSNGQEAVLCKLGDGRVRAYLGYPRSAGHRLAKPRDLPRFIDESVRTGVRRSMYERARVVGPMASFASADCWVEHPYADGIALLGDAAATCDPSFGQGMALTLRGARLLRDRLLATSDWEIAGQRYAEAQHRDFMQVHTLEQWYRTMFLSTGPEADRTRARALPAIEADLSRIPDLFGMGPDAATDETARRRFFAEA